MEKTPDWVTEVRVWAPWRQQCGRAGMDLGVGLSHPEAYFPFSHPSSPPFWKLDCTGRSSDGGSKIMAFKDRPDLGPGI